MIYFDNFATTPVDPLVLEEMIPYFTTCWANSSSLHNFGRQALQAVCESKEKIASFINCEPDEIFFTSGATESINLALKGFVENHSDSGRHIIVLQTEHRAVLDVCMVLEKRGYRVTYLPVSEDGLIDFDDLRRSLTDETILVCAMLANNETGVIQDLTQISQITHECGAFLFTNATQAFGKVPIDTEALGIDLMAFSAHKIYGPKGMGALYVRNRRQRKVRLASQIHGGGQQHNLRSGTLNVPGIVGFGVAAEIASKNLEADKNKIKPLRDELESGLLQIEGSKVVGAKNHRLYNATNIRFEGIDSTMLIKKIPELMVSASSACISSFLEPSHVLTAMGLTYEDAFSCIRFSLGRFNTRNEVLKAQQMVRQAVKEIRELNLAI